MVILFLIPISVEGFNDTSLSGRYIKLLKNNNNEHLNIAEIQVYDASGVNVARKAKVSASSTLGPFVPELLIDDNLDNFAHTDNDGDKFFMVDLQKNTTISKVVIVNRKSCCQSRVIGSELIITNEANDELFKEKITQSLPEYTFNFSVDKLNIAIENKTKDVNNTFAEIQKISEKINNPEVKAKVAESASMVNVPLSQDQQRDKLEMEQVIKDKATPESTKGILFEPATILKSQINTEDQQYDKIKSVVLDDNPSDDFVLVDPKYWMELNPEKSLCNFKCELQPVTFGGVSNFLRIKGIKTMGAEKYLK